MLARGIWRPCGFIAILSILHAPVCGYRQVYLIKDLEDKGTLQCPTRREFIRVSLAGSACCEDRGTTLLFFELARLLQDDLRFFVVELDNAADANALSLERGFRRPEFGAIVPEDHDGEDLVRIGFIEVEERRLRG
jgi:hypothetical protein